MTLPYCVALFNDNHRDEAKEVLLELIDIYPSFVGFISGDLELSDEELEHLQFGITYRSPGEMFSALETNLELISDDFISWVFGILKS